MQISQRIFNCTDMLIMHFILDKILKLLTYYTPFCHYSRCKVILSQNSPFFWPTLYTKTRFRPGLLPGPVGGAYDTSPARLGRGHPSHSILIHSLRRLWCLDLCDIYGRYRFTPDLEFRPPFRKSWMDPLLEKRIMMRKTGIL